MRRYCPVHLALAAPRMLTSTWCCVYIQRSLGRCVGKALPVLVSARKMVKDMTVPFQYLHKTPMSMAKLVEHGSRVQEFVVSNP